MQAMIRKSSSAERAFAAPDQPGDGHTGLGQADCVGWPWWRITLSELWVKEPNILKPIKYYCVDGTTQDAIPLTPNKAAFYRDAVGHWHMTGLDDVAATDSICIPFHEAIRMAVYTQQEYEDSKRILESPFIYDAGIDAEMKISKVDFEKALAANSLAKRELHQALYWQDYAFLLSNVQSGLSEIISTAGAFYESFCSYAFVGIPEKERHGVRRTDSPETRFATLLLHIIFVRMHSVLDYLVKLSLEVERQGVNFDIYPKLRGLNAQFGDRKKIDINKAIGTVFEDCVFIRTIECVRTRIIHDGHLSPNQWIYEVWDGEKISERYILFPDMKGNPGSFDSSGNRRSFYGDDTKINAILPDIIREFYTRTTLTLSMLRDKLLENRRW